MLAKIIIKNVKIHKYNDDNYENIINRKSLSSPLIFTTGNSTLPPQSVLLVPIYRKCLTLINKCLKCTLYM